MAAMEKAANKPRVKEAATLAIRLVAHELLLRTNLHWLGLYTHWYWQKWEFILVGIWRRN